jgi:hypothetical protein
MSGTTTQAPTGSSFAKRLIEVTISIGEGSFGESGFNTVTLSGLRVVASVTKFGGAAMGQAHLRIYGMPLSMMNQLSTLGMLVVATRRNNVAISAGSQGSGMSLVFQGTVVDAWADFSGAPDVSFQIAVAAGLFEAVKPVPASSYKGTADVATIMASLAEQMGFAFENNGVNVKLSNPYFPGSARQQVVRCATAANINFSTDDNKLAIWPKGQSRGGLIPLISPQTGMVGYPTFNANGLIVTTLFNPGITHGGQIKVQSSLTPANGTWIVNNLSHDLASEMPDGPWFTRMEVVPVGFLPN